MRASTLVSFFLVCCGTSAVAQEVKLRHQFRVGEKRVYTMEAENRITFNFDGIDAEIKVRELRELVREVKKVDDRGAALIELRIQRAKMEFDEAAGSLAADSADAKVPDDPIAKSLSRTVKAIAASSLTFKQTPRGEVSDIEVPDEVRARLAGLEDDDNAEFSEGSLRAIPQSEIEFPEAIAVGKSWTQTQKFDLKVGKIDRTVRYTYRGPELFNGRKVEKLSYTYETNIEPPKKGKSVLASSRGKGVVYFDNERGLFLDETAEIKLQMDIEVDGMPIRHEIVQAYIYRLKQDR